MKEVGYAASGTDETFAEHPGTQFTLGTLSAEGREGGNSLVGASLVFFQQELLSSCYI